MVFVEDIKLRCLLRFITITVSTSKGYHMYKITDYLTIKEAAFFLGVTSNTLRNWERAGKITVYRNPQNAYRLYKKEDLEQLLENIKIKGCK